LNRFLPLNLSELLLVSVYQSQIILLRITTAASNVKVTAPERAHYKGYFTPER
jgi:hypothetical protein